MFIDTVGLILIEPVLTGGRSYISLLRSVDIFHTRIYKHLAALRLSDTTNIGIEEKLASDCRA